MFEGTTYPLVSEPRCHTCTAAERTAIEMLLAAGVGYNAASRCFPGGPSAQSIRRHTLRDHVNARDEILRQVLEEAGGERSAVLREGVAAAVRRIFQASEILGPANAALMTGATTASAAQGIRAARFLAEFDLALLSEERMQALLDARLADLARLLGLVRETIPAALWRDVIQGMERDPGLRAYVCEASAA